MESAGWSQTVASTLQPDPASTPRARALVRELLADSPHQSLLDRAELCVSELVTNAILHAATEVDLRVTAGPDGLRVSVRDRSPALPALERHSTTASTGRGLAMVVAVADDWGVDFGDGPGKSVWCTLVPRTPDRQPPDIHEVLNDWRLTLSEVDRAPAAPGTTDVVLMGYPVDLGLALQEHYDAVVRECQLLVAPRPAGHELPANLVELARALAERYPTELSLLARPDPRRLAAEARGEATVDLSYPWSEQETPALRSLLRIFDEVDARARAGELLVPGITPDLVRLRAWVFDEFMRQPHGHPPVPWARVQIN